jgi:hypothetical protein
LRGKQESTNKKDLFLKISLSTAVNGQTEMGRKTSFLSLYYYKREEETLSLETLKKNEEEERNRLAE